MAPLYLISRTLSMRIAGFIRQGQSVEEICPDRGLFFFFLEMISPLASRKFLSMHFRSYFIKEKRNVLSKCNVDVATSVA